MWHTTRIWDVSPAEDPEELAGKLAQQTWCLCSAFETEAGTIWANDSTSPDGLQEFAVLRPEAESWRQVETITVSWCTAAKLAGYIGQADAGVFDDNALGRISPDQLERTHERCPHCR